jgi:hypothetical protein
MMYSIKILKLSLSLLILSLSSGCCPYLIFSRRAKSHASCLRYTSTRKRHNKLQYEASYLLSHFHLFMQSPMGSVISVVEDKLAAK